ncbi:MAG: hypothetical protein IJG38_05085 [Thermoguttaceae bacterium]|nr:hypothetical protein [Thermoguttaceae bacterium]
MPGIQYYWLRNNHIEPFSTADIVKAITIIVAAVIAAIVIWYIAEKY